MNILILTAKYGMGHYTASNSLKQELENENTYVEVLDFFDVIFPNIKTLIYSTFNFLVSKCSHVYNFFYKFMSNTSNVPFKRNIRKKIEQIIEKKTPDIIISTFPVCSKYISSYKKINNTNLKLYTYITDVDVSREWITDETDNYFVASFESKKQLENFGIMSDKVIVTGIPVRKEFKENSFEKIKNEIVVMGGGLGLLSSFEKVLTNLLTNKNIHITLLTGKNQRLFNKYYNKFPNMTVIGYTDDVYKYMKRAELIITKPGGITLFEAINSKTPIYVLCPFLSQELGNAKFIEQNGIGRVIWSKNENISSDIFNLLSTPSILQSMQKNMQIIKNSLEQLTVIDIYKRGNISRC